MTLATTIDPAARAILGHYTRDVESASWIALGNAGGFSGARLWRGHIADGRQLCLRAWPTGRITEDRLRIIHNAITRCSLSFVPQLIGTIDGRTWLGTGKQFWEITTWMPGTADFHHKSTDAKLFAAMRALAEIHRRLLPTQAISAPCPAVTRILRAMREWRDLIQSGWKPDYNLPLSEMIHFFARRAWDAIAVSAYSVEYSLVEWEARPLPVQLCLCDVWHDHILYEGDRVTGVIDYGAVKNDCVAIDLARLLGSMIPDEPERMQLALAIYSAGHPVHGDVLKLVTVLDLAGSIVGLTNWLRWLYRDKKSYGDLARVSGRMEELLKRVEMKKPTAFGSWAE